MAAQLQLPAPGAGRLCEGCHVGARDRLRREGVRIATSLNYPSIDHEMHDVYPRRAEFSGQTLGEPADRKLAHGKDG